jgi:signal transduction histidine kinase/DNA-binding response OmpR family regulator
VYIRSGVKELDRRLTLYWGIAALVLLVSLLAALLVSSIFKKSFARPIVRLAEISRIVSRDKDYSVRIAPIRGKNELAVLFDAYNEMLSQIRQNEEALQRAHNELEHRVQERTAELVTAKEEVERTSKFKDQFLSTMSHELRTPLNAVLGFSEMLMSERYGPLNERQQRYVNHIHTGGQHLHRLINDILDISKIEAGRMQLAIESVQLPLAFSEVTDALHSLVEKKSQVLMQNAPPGLNVLADPIRLKQILMNLLGNAIKFTPQGGRIELGARQQGDLVRIEIRDSGPGIPPEEQQHIFEAFHRLRQSESAAEGTGLGLAITRSLVELHKGQLGLESRLGEGSCFYFTLPAASISPADPAPKAKTEFHTVPSARVLVIEDDPAAAQLIESQLAFIGYEILLCDQPQLAVEMAAELQPAAITLDIVMKPVNGWEILSNLKGDPRTAKIPVIVVTILDQREMGTLLGAEEYIVKPVDRTILLAALERCLGPQGHAHRGRSILVVEDDAPTREFIAEVLSRSGYIVRTASDGALARSSVRTSLPDLVILDLLLPEVNGFELLKEWRGNPRTADLPVLVLTSKDLTPEERKYLKENVGSFFSKQDQWQDALLRRILRAEIQTPPGESE